MNSIPTVPTWAANKHYYWHSNPESRPVCQVYFDKCYIRPKKDHAWDIIKSKDKSAAALAYDTINLYNDDNSNMMAGRSVQEMCNKLLLENESEQSAISFGSDFFENYHPRDWDNGRDIDKHQINIAEFVDVFKSATNGIKEAANQLRINRLEGEENLMFKMPGLNLPYNGIPDFNGSIELKTKWSSISSKAKSGKTTASLPSKPLYSHVCQVAGYWFEKKRPQAIVYANKNDFRIFTDQNCELLTEEALNGVIRYMTGQLQIRENQMKAAKDVESLLRLVSPQFNHMWAWDYKSEVLREAKQIWGF